MTGQLHTEFQWGHLREKDCYKDLRVEGRIILKWIAKK